MASASACLSCGCTSVVWPPGPCPRCSHVHAAEPPPPPPPLSSPKTAAVRFVKKVRARGGAGGNDAGEPASSLLSSSSAGTPTAGTPPQHHHHHRAAERSTYATLKKWGSRTAENLRHKASQLGSEQPAFADAERRRASFGDSWPHVSPTVAQLAAAGFFFKPGKHAVSDRVICFACKLALSHFAPQDDPALIHRREKPGCPHVVATAEGRASGDSGRGSSEGYSPSASAAPLPAPSAAAAPSASSLSSSVGTDQLLPTSLPPPSVTAAAAAPAPAPPTATPTQKELVRLRRRAAELEDALVKEEEVARNLAINRKMKLQMLQNLKAENAALKLRLSQAQVEGAATARAEIALDAKTGEVSAGTLDALMERLYLQDQLSISDYVNTFLLTFRSFTTPHVLFDELEATYRVYAARGGPAARRTAERDVRRRRLARAKLEAAAREDFDEAHRLKVEIEALDAADVAASAALGGGDDEDGAAAGAAAGDEARLAEGWTDEMVREQEAMRSEMMRLRVVLILKRWLEKHFHDFTGEEHFFDTVKAFVRACDEKDAALLGKVLDVAEKAARGETVLIAAVTEAPPPSLLPEAFRYLTSPHSVNPLDVSPREMARQLTMLEWRLYEKLAPKEMLNLGWQREDAAARSPALLRLIERFNQTSNWITLSLVREPDLKRRGKLLAWQLKLLQELRALSNLNGVFEIVSGLVASPAARLRHTWDAVPSKARSRFDAACRLADSKGNFATYREALAGHLHAACLPYVGLFLNDLTLIEEGNPTFLPDGRVNFAKFTLVSEVIRRMLQHQRAAFNFATVPLLADYLGLHEVVPEKEAFELSLQVEPRGS